MTTMRNRRHRPVPRGSRGVAVVEFALILPLLVTFLVGMVEFGHVWFLQHALTNASREGARVGVVYRLNSWGYQLEGGKKVENTVKKFLGEEFCNYHKVKVEWTTPEKAKTGDDLKVTVTAQQNVTLLLDALIQWFKPGFKGIQVGAVTTMRLE